MSNTNFNLSDEWKKSKDIQANPRFYTGFRLGDKVSYTNENGIKFTGLIQ